MKQLLLLVGLVVIAALLYVGAMLLLGAITKYKPEPEEVIELQKAKAGNDNPALLSDTSYSFLIWNIGYGALGKEVDFFYDGGKTVTSPREYVVKNLNGIRKFLAESKEIDFVLLQEVDRNSKRSYHTDEVADIAGVLDNHSYAFAANYKVVYLPFPFTDPIGKVHSGIQTLSKYHPVESKRISLPGISDFPRKLFYLERCLLMQRYKLAGGKELIVINTHFEAYDDGSVKKQQMALTKKLVEEEYAKGNYVIIGGDWNIAPPTFNVHTFEKEPEDELLYTLNNDPNYIPGWTYAFDSTIATNRKNKTVFNPEKTFTTVIDYYFVSPNVEVTEVKGVDLGFDCSDHQPVRMRVTLR